MLYQGCILFCQSYDSVTECVGCGLKLLSFRNQGVIIGFELVDRCVIVLKVLELCFRVLNNCGFERLGVEIARVGGGFWELKLKRERRDRLRRHDCKIDLS